MIGNKKQENCRRNFVGKQIQESPRGIQGAIDAFSQIHQDDSEGKDNSFLKKYHFIRYF
jgi:hypothetical protein